MALQKDNRLAWGITMLVFGAIFLVKELNVLPTDIAKIVFDIKNYPLIIGGIFLFTHKNKNIAVVLIVVGILFRLSEIISWSQQVSDFIWPMLLMAAGAILVFGHSKKK